MTERDRWAIVLAGGRGTRMGSLTDDRPKPLLMVAGEPLIAHQLRRLWAAGISQVAISTGYRAELFPAVLGRGTDYGLSLEYVRETQPKGTGGALAAAIDELGLVSGDVVLAVNGDLISTHDLHEHLAAYAVDRAAGALATLHVRSVPDVRQYGAVMVDQAGFISRFEEKPDRPADARSGVVNAGTYVFDPALLDTTSRVGHVSWERDVLPAALARGIRIGAFRQDCTFLDVGTPGSLAAAEQLLGTRGSD
ncbi:nucleotidyltransferase family protein [Demetria terragena]|uniref:nucleotidyltransferase family protein n=1 Tax=Demetria terragena TaxID=63959 RepID=UPI00037061CA|nr:nucleotidyltransferase family protein [Demetria terragena]